jgi:hypothetical protein
VTTRFIKNAFVPYILNPQEHTQRSFADIPIPQCHHVNSFFRVQVNRQICKRTEATLHAITEVITVVTRVFHDDHLIPAPKTYSRSELPSVAMLSVIRLSSNSPPPLVSPSFRYSWSDEFGNKFKQPCFLPPLEERKVRIVQIFCLQPAQLLHQLHPCLC